MEISIEFNPEAIVGKLSALGKVQLPLAASNALNRTVYQIQQAHREEARSIFKDPVQYTISGFQYTKSTPQTLEAKVFINPDPQKGNPRSEYLAPHIYGGLAYRTRFQKSLSRTRDPSLIGTGAILAPNRIMVPTQSPGGVRFTSRGNMSPGQYEQINTYLQNTDSTRTALTGRRKARAAGRRYFYMNQAMVDERRNLKVGKPGVFLVVGGRLPMMRVMTETPTPTFTGKFQFFEIGTRVASEYFPKFLAEQKFL
jgi:hypothetical protein